MLVVEVSKFETEDFNSDADRAAARRAVLKVILVVSLPVALITAGAAVLLVRHGIDAGLALLPVIICWLFLGTLVKKLFRPLASLSDAPTQYVLTQLVPMRVIFGDEADRVRVEMPIGHSSIGCDHFACWRIAPRMLRLELKEGGTFHIPRRYTDAATENAVEAFLSARGVRIQRSDI
jgi:hypothetical protein